MSVYDGQRLCGRIIALDDRRKAFAFDDGDRLLGEFPSRVIALRAVFDQQRLWKTHLTPSAQPHTPRENPKEALT